MNVTLRSIVISALLALAAGLFMPAFAQNSKPPSANGTVASVAGTSWTVTETIGDNDVFNFMADGSLHYSYQKGSYTNGTWKQDGDAIYIEMNNKYVEYQGQITGTHMEGKAWNVKGKNWTWAADKR